MITNLDAIKRVKSGALRGFCTSLGVPEKVQDSMFQLWEANPNDRSYLAFFNILASAFRANAEGSGQNPDSSPTPNNLLSRFVQFHEYAMQSADRHAPSALHGQIMRAMVLGYSVLLDPSSGSDGQSMVVVSVDRPNPSQDEPTRLLRAQLGVPQGVIQGAEIDILAKVVCDLTDRHSHPTDYSTSQ